MKQHIESLLRTALQQLEASGELPAMPAVIQIDPTKDKQFGDFATNVAMILAKPAQKKPREVAERLIQALPASPYVLKVDIAGPGFINFFLSTAAAADVVVKILAEKEQFGRSKLGREKKVFNEFVSSNPTGPLHVGHGRHAAYGDVVSNLLEAVGFKVSREYYVNDAGRQMDILATSVWMRYLEICGENIIFPANGYQGGYIAHIAKAIHGLHGMHFLVQAEQIFANLPLDEPAGGDKELYIDALIERSKALLGEDKYEAIFDVALQNILADMREDLSEFGIHYDEWFSERSMVKMGMVDRTLERLEKSKHTYMKDGALWFRSTDFGDEKDRVLVRSNGQRTYFANDVAHHLYKFDSGYDIAIVVLGSDHHGYTARMKAAVQACLIDPERLINLLVQFVSLYRGSEQVPMSTRGGNFVTLRELREEVGNDAARFFYVMRKHEQAMDFDLELAKSRSNENPVYYVQYAHARICSVFKQLEDRGIAFDQKEGLASLSLLVEPQERELLNTLSRYPDMILDAALSYGPHMLTHYLRDVAADFHTYYNAHQFLVDDSAQRNARLALISATRQVLLNGFGLLGISSPETM
jgi:arginyl-tRNA synthetase